jgi:hypothetical protein
MMRGGIQMKIINDSGGIPPIIVRFATVDLLKIHGSQIEYLCDELSPMIQQILLEYKQNQYDYSPNPDYDKCIWLCQQLTHLGMNNCEVVIVQ